jgi:hypothetical protein
MCFVTIRRKAPRISHLMPPHEGRFAAPRFQHLEVVVFAASV